MLYSQVLSNLGKYSELRQLGSKHWSVLDITRSLSFERNVWRYTRCYMVVGLCLKNAQLDTLSIMGEI